MNNTLLLAMAFAMIIASVSAVYDASQAQEQVQVNRDPVPLKGQYIVVLKEDVNAADIDDFTNVLASDLNIQIRHKYDVVIKGFSFTIPDSDSDVEEALLAKVRSYSTVAFVQQEVQFTAAVFASLRSGEIVPTGVSRVGASANNTVQAPSTSGIAVLDTGIDLKHPDLYLGGGINCFDNQSPQDDNGHGTHVAGIIAAKNNGAGIVGVAAGSKLYSVKVLDKNGIGSTSSMLCGVNWVAKYASVYRIRVASVSAVGAGYNDNNCGYTNNDALHQAICKSSKLHNILYVAAAGNHGSTIVGTIPASYPETLTVTAFADSDGAAGGVGEPVSCLPDINDDSIASFSNYGDSNSASHIISAPGVCIQSTWPASISPYNYNVISGTSVATPHVSGAVALCIGTKGAAGPCGSLTPSEIIQYIREQAANHSSIDDASTSSSKYYGHMIWVGDF